MYCQNCGTQLSDDAKFCHNCGGNVSGSAGNAPTTPAPEPVVSAPAAPVSAPAPAAPIPQEVPAYKAPVTAVLDNATPAKVKPKKRRTGLIIGICAGVVALLLAIALLAGYFFFDWFKPESDDDDKKESSSQREDDEDDEEESDSKNEDDEDDEEESDSKSEDDEGDEEESDSKSEDDEDAEEESGSQGEDEEDDAPVEIELNVKEAELVYELTDDDVDAFYELLASTEELAIKGKDEDAIMEAVEELDDSFVYLQSQLSIASVLYYCDLEDTEASDLYLSCTEMVTEANDEYIKMCRRVYESDSPAKDAFFEEWTEQDIQFLVAYTDEVMELVQRNSEIEVEYQMLQDESDLYEAMVPLYIEMVQNNNRIAQIYGYDNYYEYAYEVEYMRDYDPKQVEVMREYVAEYFPDALDDAIEQFGENLAELNDSDYTKVIDLLLESYEDNAEDYIIGYLKTLPKQTRNDMLDMLDGNIVMMDGADNAMEGAFTTSVGMDRQICFFGPGCSDAMTLIHEVGHYYGGSHEYLNDLPLDLAETHSQGNEWLFLQYLESEMSEDAYRTLVDYRFVNDLSMIMVCVIVDEFEQQVYTHPDIDTLTSDDLDEIMEDVCQNYGGINYVATNITDMQEYWRMVVVEQPVYYISYAVSAVASIDLYTVARDDYDAAVKIYQDLIENCDLEDGFLGNITAAGLSSPFDEEFYQEVSELVED